MLQFAPACEAGVASGSDLARWLSLQFARREAGLGGSPPRGLKSFNSPACDGDCDFQGGVQVLQFTRLRRGLLSCFNSPPTVRRGLIHIKLHQLASIRPRL